MKREDACACGEFCDCALSGSLKMNTAIPSGEKIWQQGYRAGLEGAAKWHDTDALNTRAMAARLPISEGTRGQLNRDADEHERFAVLIRLLPVPK